VIQAPQSAATSVGPHILVVEDDPELRDFIAHYLGDFDMRVSCVGDGKAMRQALAQSVIDLVLLDLKLPNEDGLMLARELRATSSVPIIMVTSRNGEADRVLGLELGADDYLIKPFSARELVARIRTILRRSHAHPVPANDGPRGLRFAGWELDLRSRRLLSSTGDRAELTRAEFALLRVFLSAPRRVLSRDQLIEVSRGYDDDVFDRSVDVQILRLRRKLEVDPSRPRLIRTERGLGYSFDASVEAVD
jgi:two-component system, OmpR family, response regulator